MRSSATSHRARTPSALFSLSATLAFIAVACSTKPVVQPSSSFDGEWKVQWCNKARPDLDCGGFWLTLVEREGRICGTYMGARVNLAQVDEGDRRAVEGMRSGDIAHVTITSLRSGNVYRAQAELVAGRLHWKVTETISERDEDIDIIAVGDTLERVSGKHSDGYAEVAEACNDVVSTP